MKHILFLALAASTLDMTAGGSQSKVEYDNRDIRGQNENLASTISSLNNYYTPPLGRVMTEYERDMYLFGKDYADEWKDRQKDIREEQKIQQKENELYYKQQYADEQAQLIYQAMANQMAVQTYNEYHGTPSNGQIYNAASARLHRKN